MNIFYAIISLSLTFLLTSCIDLSGSRSSYMQSHVPLRSASPFKGEVHTMRGGLGIFSIGMNQLKDKTASLYHISSHSTMWYNAGYVSRYIIARYYQDKDHSPIILVGHSLGANEQIKVARNLNKVGIPVALLVTVDAVSQTIIPPNVHHALNLYKPGYVPMFSGLRLRAVDPSKTVIENINVENLPGIQVNHFTIDKNPKVQEIILNRISKVLVHV